ncbi:hypothetical protein KEM48_008750 [Puccinia striiformis f. sp. tritici PST-130]|nr:hypothetical protein KEM48_008750 [Puccinia striiformis f. sp. tritici PST-130]
METTANEGQPSSADVGNDSTADLVPDLDPGEDNPDNDDTIVTVATTLPTTSPTKRKRSSAISPDVLFSELKNMSASFFDPYAGMCACSKHPDLEPQQIFDVIDFLALNNNSGVHVFSCFKQTPPLQYTGAFSQRTQPINYLLKVTRPLVFIYHNDSF